MTAQEALAILVSYLNKTPVAIGEAQHHSAVIAQALKTIENDLQELQKQRKESNAGN